MSRNLNECVAVYKTQLAHGAVQAAYECLMKYMMTLRMHFTHALGGSYNVGNVSPGYMDITYFPFFNGFLKNRGLRFGIVLNHQQMRYELWLMAQNAEVHEEYWDILKSSVWNRGCTEMPKYAVLETVLVENPDFSDLVALSAQIREAAVETAEEIMHCIPV